MCSYTQHLITRNRKWALEQSALSSHSFINSSKEQTPDTFWIGCSDSCVPSELIAQQSVGDLFVHINIANQIIVDDLNVIKQVHTLLSFPLIQVMRRNKLKLKVHCMMYDLSSDHLKDLDLSYSTLEDFSAKLTEQGYC